MMEAASTRPMVRRLRPDSNLREAGSRPAWRSSRWCSPMARRRSSSWVSLGTVRSRPPAAAQLAAHVLENLLGFVASFEQLLGIGPGDFQQAGVGAQNLSQGLGLDKGLEQQQQVAGQRDAVFEHQAHDLVVDILDRDGLEGAAVEGFAHLLEIGAKRVQIHGLASIRPAAWKASITMS